MKDHLKQLEDDTNELCELRMKLCKMNKTDPWNMEDLKVVLKQLKDNKSRDPDNYNHEIFKESVAGTDLLQAVLNLMNCIKKQQKYPKQLRKSNITPIHKKKSKKLFQNYRGIFRVQTLRTILDRLIYNQAYPTIDQNLTDGNVGARKNRGVRDNIFVMSAITNSVLKGKFEPIQAQVIDAETCFDKLWLQSCINSLFEAGLDNDLLNLLYLENKEADIAIKINNKLTKRIKIKDIIMQGTVWSSLKCTTTMDKLNKIMMKNPRLQYFYKQDPNIPIGVMGMVDDILSISKCGNETIEKNAVINSFMETERLTISKEKSSVIHIGNTKKCEQSCPKIKVHTENMKINHSTKYLGNILSSNGGIKETISDRRNKGWGLISKVKAILDEVPLGPHRVEAGLLLRRAMLVNSLLFTAETWSGLSERDLARLQVVDTAMMRAITGGHSKTAVEFHFLETGTLMLKHILSINRLMYHHHLITREDNETIKKVYNKQKEDNTKGDWFDLLMKDFNFIGVEMDENHIKQKTKEEYKKEIKEQINEAAFNELLQLKQNHSKLKEVKYLTFSIQPYLISKQMTKTEKTLLYLMRSKCHKSKNNFRKMFQNDTKCSFKCDSIKDQVHTFTQCLPVLSKISKTANLDHSKIFQNFDKQMEVISIFLEIEEKRQELKEQFLPGEKDARTQEND